MLQEVQEKTAKALNESPVNKEVKLSEEETKNLTYGPVVDNAKVIDFKFVNSAMDQWVNNWNRIMN